MAKSFGWKDQAPAFLESLPVFNAEIVFDLSASPRCLADFIPNLLLRQEDHVYFHSGGTNQIVNIIFNKAEP